MTQSDLPTGSDAETMTRLRHDIRNALTSAMMSADLLAHYDDPSVARHASVILNALEKTLVLLKSVRSSAQ